MKSTIGPLIGREWYRIVIVACTMVLASCSSTQPPVPIEAADASLSSLAGNWVGEYSSSATGRRGSIVFNLKADDKSATGDVVMYSTIVQQPYNPNRPGPVAKPLAVPLTITFVRVQNGQISGKLDSYRDPTTSAMLTTTFAGRQRGNTIEGTFESMSADALTPQLGRWRVTRQ